MFKTIKILIILFLNFFFLNISFSEENLALKKKADAGDAIFQNNYGYNLIRGVNGSSENDELGMEYIKKAANQNQVNAMITLGWNYFSGDDGLDQDFEKSIYWTTRAANLRTHGMATYNLGLFYFAGLAGLPQDLDQAKKKWNLACKQWPQNNNYNDPATLLDEINTYSNKLTRQMKKIRDDFIICISSLQS